MRSGDEHHLSVAFAHGDLNDPRRLFRIAGLAGGKMFALMGVRGEHRCAEIQSKRCGNRDSIFSCSCSSSVCPLWPLMPRLHDRDLDLVVRRSGGVLGGCGASAAGPLTS